MSKEAMKLALEAAYLAGFNASGEGYNSEYPFGDHARNPEEDAAWIKDRDNALRKALAEQPAQQLPFGVGGGLVAIKTLLSRDPCVHANTAIEMIDAILAEQPAPMIRGDIRDGLVDDEPAQSSKPFDTHAAPGQSFDTHSRTLQQEPVVWMYVNKSTHETKFQKHMRDFIDHSLWSEVPLYGEPLANHELQCICGAVWHGDEMVHLPDKRPPTSKPWAGLTEEEIANMIREASKGSALRPMNAEPTSVRIARVVEAKLKEKNT